MLDAAFFESFRPFTAPWKQHNAALKWFRQLQEGADPAAARPLVFNNTEKVAVAAIRHADKGTEFDFDETETVWWFWMEMVSQMDAESIQFVCGGPQGRSRGLVRCEFSVRENSYDHARHHAKRKSKQPHGNPQLRCWDFKLIREDGTGVRVHPSWKVTKIATFDADGYAEEVVPPEHGLGKSDGGGTYKYYKTLGTGEELRFDPNKRPVRAPIAG